MTARFTAAALTGITLLILGCGTSPGSRRSADSVTPDLVVRTVRDNHSRVQTMEGSGQISIETPELAQSGSFTFLLKKPDSLMVTIEGPFGIDLGSALITRKDFLFYNSFQNRAISGETNPSNLFRIFRLSITFDDLLSFFAGGTFLASDLSLPSDLTSTDDSYTLRVSAPLGERQYLLDPESLLIQQIRQLNRSGVPILEQEFGDFRAVNGVVVPFRVRVTLRREQRRAAVRYSSVNINEAVGDFSLTIPGNAERIELR